MRVAKFWVALIGGSATSAIVLLGAESTAGKVAAIISAGCTAAAVWAVPNDPAPKV